MKKKISQICVLVILSLFFATPTFAAAKSGQKCLKAGAVETVGTKKFTCLKSGKKLIWDKGKDISKVSNGSSQVLTPTKQPSPTPTPTVPSEKYPSAPSSFEDLEANYEGIPYSSWRSAQKNLELYKDSNVKISFKFGPNTKERYPNQITEDAVRLGSRVMGAQKQPTELRFIAYSRDDVDWARKEAEQYVSPFSLGNSLSDQAAEKCAGIDCDGAVTNIASGIGLVLVGVPTPVDRYRIQQFKGQNDAHEFVHAVQGMIFASQGGKPPATRTPCWFSEGQPQAISIVSTSKTYSDYVSARKGWVVNNRWLLKDFEPESIEEFMLAGMKVPCPAFTTAMNFSLGYIIVDAMVAAGGIDKTFDIQKEILTGLSFEDAFKKVYGLSWSDGSKILARVASRTYKDLKQ